MREGAVRQQQFEDPLESIDREKQRQRQRKKRIKKNEACTRSKIADTVLCRELLIAYQWRGSGEDRESV